MQVEPEEVRQESVVAETAGMQFGLELFVPVLTLAPQGVLVVDRRRKDPTTWPVRDHGSSIGPLSIRFHLDDNRLRRRPTFGLIIDQPEQPLWLTGPLVLFESLFQQVVTERAKP